MAAGQLLDQALVSPGLADPRRHRDREALQAAQQVAAGAFAAQMGETPADAKPLKGFGGAGVLEVIEDHQGDTYRAVYTVRFERTVYALHAFQKKSKQGIATPKKELDLIRERLKWAERIHARKSTEV